MNEDEQKQMMIDHFRQVKNVGWVQSHRNHNTGIGKTFEDCVGVIENNAAEPDLYGFEIKSHREDSTSPLTLFTKTPSNQRGANIRLKELFGVPDNDFPNTKVLHASFWGDRYGVAYNRFKFRLENDRQSRRVYIRVYDMDGILLDGETYYNYESVQSALNKLNKLFYVEADRRTNEQGIEEFHYTSAEIYTNPSFYNFMQLIDEGYIQYDFRIGVYKSGNKTGKTHDHGSGFRINKNDVYRLYGDMQIIE